MRQPVRDSRPRVSGLLARSGYSNTRLLASPWLVKRTLVRTRSVQILDFAYQSRASLKRTAVRCVVDCGYRAECL